LIQQLQEALGEKKEVNGVRWNHHSSGDLMHQRQELSWRSKVCDIVNMFQVRPHFSLV
jgi:hypothetical protein